MFESRLGLHRSHAELMGQRRVPMVEGGGIGLVHFDRREQGTGAAFAQGAIQAPAESAVAVGVVRIAEGEQRIVELFQPRFAGATEMTVETPCGNRRIALAVGADHEQRLAMRAEAGRAEFAK